LGLTGDEAEAPDTGKLQLLLTGCAPSGHIRDHSQLTSNGESLNSPRVLECFFMNPGKFHPTKTLG